MSRIHLLDEALINKIAAGEVVERPASVVKELIENAVDAGATEIRIEVAEGGKSLIRVSDDGLGMAAEDARLALQRHATSKINGTEDLFHIQTMGFRGEALAAIASVSDFTLQTRPAGQDKGTMVRLDEQGQVHVNDWQGPQGTIVTVTHLFSRIPARLAFLKSDGAEYAAILELVRHVSLAFPEISWTLIHNDKMQLYCPKLTDERHSTMLGEKTLRTRAQAVLAEEEIHSLIYFTKQTTHGRVEGLISTPGQEKSVAKYLFTFVNRRAVKDKNLRFAVQRGYHSHLLKGQYPVALVYVHVDPSTVDVNVHPAKAEVRFQYPQDIQDLIAFGIRDQLRAGAWSQPAPTTPAVSPGLMPQLRQEVAASLAPRREMTMDGGGSVSRYTGPVSRPPVERDLSVTVTRQTFDWTAPVATPAIPSAAEIPAAENAVDWSALQYMGTFAQCYLLFTTADQLLVVDQHAFHERILYEKFMREPEFLSLSEPMLMPDVLLLSPEHVAVLADNAALAKRIGFEWQKVSDTELEILAAPAPLKNRNFETVLGQLADQLLQHQNMQPDEFWHDIAATLACHSAVRAGEELSFEDLQIMLKQAQDVDFYHNCPHGRRVLRWFQTRDVAAWFDRV